jgi:heat-inducible transcriptional repressor
MNQTEREKLILKHVVQHFIETGNPVGSRFISKHLPIEWSAATIRNIMADLEEQGFLGHPHPSAGRVPTDKGYRAYVDAMMDSAQLSPEEQNAISSTVLEISRRISRVTEGIDEILYFSSKALAKISNELGIVLSPRFNLCVFEKLDLIAVAPDRILVELSLRSGFVKTVMLEVRTSRLRDELHYVNELLNERLSGLSVAEIRRTLTERVRDLQYRFEDQEEGFVQVFLRSADKLFNFDDKNLLSYSGTQNILSKPDRADPGGMYAIIQLLEEKNHFVDLLSARSEHTGVAITIGGENDVKEMNACSIVTANYRMGDVTGTVGVIGPKRMPYAKIISLVQHTAGVLDKALNDV